MSESGQNEHSEFQAEYQVIKKDVIKVAVTNAIIVILLAALFFADKKFGFLENLQNIF